MAVRTPSPSLDAPAPVLQGTETAPTQSEDLWALFRESVTDVALFLLDPRGTITSWSRGAECLTGYTESDILGHHFSCLYPPEEQATGAPVRFLQQVASTRRGEEEGWRVRKDGTRFYAQGVVTALYDAQGQFRGFGNLTRDVTAHRQAEAALRESEARSRELVENANDAIATFTVDGRITSFNRGAERMLGWSREEVLGRSYRDFYTPASVALADDRTRRFLAGEKLPSTFEVEERCKDGRIIVAETRTRPFYDATGTLIGFQGIQRDITERKKAEAVLRQQQELNTALLQAQSDLGEGVAIVDPHTQRFLYVNDALCSLYGYSAAELLALPSFLALVVPEDQAQFRARLAQRQQGQSVENHYEMVVQRKDGARIAIEVAVTHITGPDGGQIVALIRDITARKQTEEALRCAHAELEQRVHERTAALSRTNFLLQQESANHQRAQEALAEWKYRYETALQASGQVYFEWDTKTKNIVWGEGIEAMLGYTPQEMTGDISQWRALVHPEDRPRVLEDLVRIQATKSPWQAKYRLQSKDGSYRWVESRGIFFRTHPEQITSLMIGFLSDITVQTQAEDSLRAAHQRLRSHIENSPLAVIEWDSTLRVCQWSPRAEQVFGWQATEVLGKRRQDWRFVVVADDPRVQQAIAPFLHPASSNTTALSEAHENRNYTKDGRILQCVWYNSFLYDEKGQLTSILSLVQDITARRTAEEALQLSEARFKAQYQNMPLTTTTWRRSGEDFVLIDYNQAAVNLSSGAVARFLGSRARELHHDDPAFLKGLLHSFTHQTVYQEERFQQLKSTGEQKYFKITYVFAPPDLVMVHREDLTARKQMEDVQRFLFEATAQLALSLDYKETLTRVAQLAASTLTDWCAIYLRGDTGHIQSLIVADKDSAAIAGSATLQSLASLPSPVPHVVSRVIQKGCAECYAEIPAALLDEIACGDTELLHKVRRLNLSTVMVVPIVGHRRSLGAVLFAAAANSGRRYGDAEMNVLKEVAGRIALAIENAHLYHEAREAQEALTSQAAELQRAHADLRQVAYICAHDLQEPVRQVTIYTQKLAKHYGSAVEARIAEAIGFVLEGTQRITAQLRDLLDYIDVDSPHTTAQTLIDTEEVFKQALHALHTAITESGAVVTHSPLPHITAYAPHLQQVWHELLDNALKFRRSVSPRIHVWAEREAHGWRFAVQDNGIGIDPQYYGQLFGFFKRLDRHRAPGTGMGLAICKKIIERYGGRIWLEPTPGGGVTVVFTIDDIDIRS